jgi:ubiquinone/menaquinone biosynthesis C-methylase UbiE
MMLDLSLAPGADPCGRSTVSKAPAVRAAQPAGWAANIRRAPATPSYLETLYWWAYLHPRAIWVFERQWLVNAILFGNYARLRDAALNALGERLPGLTLQIACVYGDFSDRLGRRARAGEGRLEVVDVVPAQIKNLRDKLSAEVPAGALLMDCAALDLPNARYDRAVVFFLLHEQPEAWRRRTLAEALRVVRPGGRIVIVDYAKPRWWHPLRYLLRPVLARLEPFALDLWRAEIATFLPPSAQFRALRRRTVFGGLYQEIVIER